MAVLCFAVSTKEIVMGENEFEYNGKIYVATCHCEDIMDSYCNDCSLKGYLCAEIDPPCLARERVDGMHVIFVEKQS